MKPRKYTVELDWPTQQYFSYFSKRRGITAELLIKLLCESVTRHHALNGFLGPGPQPKQQIPASELERESARV